MKLPEKLSMHESLHGTGAKGMAVYMYEDNEGLGVVQETRRENGRSPFLTCFQFKWLPDQSFGSYGALCAAVAELSDEAIAAEKAKWPQMRDNSLTERDDSTGTCFKHTDRPATHTGSIDTCWIPGTGEFARLCAECAGAAATGDASVIHAASAQRRADVAARKDKARQ